MEGVVGVMITTTFNNHFYKWHGKIFKQKKGGSVGLKETGSCAIMVMDSWITKFRELLETNKVEVFLLKKYVDDVLLIVSTHMSL